MSAPLGVGVMGPTEPSACRGMEKVGNGDARASYVGIRATGMPVAKSDKGPSDEKRGRGDCAAAAERLFAKCQWREMARMGPRPKWMVSRDWLGETESLCRRR